MSSHKPRIESRELLALASWKILPNKLSAFHSIEIKAHNLDSLRLIEFSNLLVNLPRVLGRTTEATNSQREVDHVYDELIRSAAVDELYSSNLLKTVVARTRMG